MYDAVLAVIREDRTVKDVAAVVGVSRQTLYTWLARYWHSGWWASRLFPDARTQLPVTGDRRLRTGDPAPL